MRLWFTEPESKEEEKAEGHIEGEEGGIDQDLRDAGLESCTTKFLYFIIFCIFLFICSLAINDAPSPLKPYPSGSGSMLVIPSSFML